MARPLEEPRCGGGVLGVVLLVMLQVLGVENASAEPATRVVRPGDCLSALAEEHAVTVEQIRQWNRLKGDVIHTGQRLIVAEPQSRRSGKAKGVLRAGNPTSYTVVAGDSLSEVALRHGVEVDDIVALNPGLDPDHVEVGQRLAIPHDRRQPEAHVVRRGETLSRIAVRYGIDVDDILRWNRGLRAHSLSVGRRLTVYPRKLPPSESIGRPYSGKLANGRRLQPHPLFVIRDPVKAWGTEETVQWIQDAFDEVQTRHKRVPRVRVHDLSLREGGPIVDHRSHESGRDVDLTYYQRRCPRSGCDLRSVLPREVLVAPQWTLLHHWIRRGRAQVIFIDYDIQAVLYRQAQRRGASAAQLATWFQYPRGRRAPGGIIRHAGNHRNHLHVRFVCPRGDSECQY